MVHDSFYLNSINHLAAVLQVPKVKKKKGVNQMKNAAMKNFIV